MPEGEKGESSIHPDDELVEQAHFRDQARGLVEYRFPQLVGEAKERKVREVAEVVRNYLEARTDFDISQWEKEK